MIASAGTVRLLAFAFPTALVLGNVQRFAFAFPKSPEVIGVASLACAFDLLPSSFRSHEGTKEPAVHLPFDNFNDELGGLIPLYCTL
jgi:hypothetical protein